jgi:hypothetical protein
MGKFNAVGANDMAALVREHTFTAATQTTAAAPVHGVFNVSVIGTLTGTIVVERSFDGGTTWVQAWAPGTTTLMQFTAPGSVQVTEPEPGVAWRLRASALTAGTPLGRISQ